MKPVRRRIVDLPVAAAGAAAGAGAVVAAAVAAAATSQVQAGSRPVPPDQTERGCAGRRIAPLSLAPGKNSLSRPAVRTRCRVTAAGDDRIIIPATLLLEVRYACMVACRPQLDKQKQFNVQWWRSER